MMKRSRRCDRTATCRTRARCTIAALAAIFLVVATQAAWCDTGQQQETKPTIDIVGLREFTLLPRKDEATQTFRLPVRGPADVLKDVIFRTDQVSVGGELKETAIVTVTKQAADAKSGAGPALSVVFNLEKADTVGTYVATIRVSRLDKEAEQIVLKFTRSPAVLVAPESFRAERVVYIPFVWEWLYRSRLVLHETSGKSACSLTDAEWKSGLVRADRKPVHGQMTFALPAAIDAWGQGEVQLSVDGHVPLGSATGSLTVHSRQLATQLDVPVEIVRRWSLVWLMIAIGPSIYVGYYTRTWLENRSLLLEARVAAGDVCRELKRVVDVTQDTELRRELEAVVRDLQQAAAEKTQPADIMTATEDAKTSFDGYLNAAATERQELSAKIATWRGALGLPEYQADGLEQAVRNYVQQFDAQEEVLANGSRSTVRDFFETDVVGIPGALFGQAETWLSQMETVVSNIGQWPNTLLATAMSQLTQQLTTARVHLNEQPALDKVGPLLANTAATTRTIRYRVLTSGRDALVRLGEDIDNTIHRLLPDLAQTDREKKVASQLQDLVVLVEDVKAISDFDELGRKAKQLAEALRAVLLGAYELWKTEDDPATPDQLDQGGFAGALEDVQNKRTEATKQPRPMQRTRSLAGTPSLPGVSALAAETLPPLASLPPAWSIEIRTPDGPITANEPAKFVAQLQVAEGRSVPHVKLVWSVNGVVAKESSPGDISFQYTPSAAGKLLVTVLATTADDRESTTARATIEVVASIVDALASMRQELGRTRRVQNIVFGMLIAVAGFIMFKGTFVGTVNDFFVAGLWGFTVDIGVAKVLQIAQPVMTRTVLGNS